VRQSCGIRAADPGESPYIPVSPCSKEVIMTDNDHWTLEAVQTLVALVKEGTPPSVISLKLKRSIADVRAKITDLGLTPPIEA
jgi:hypothetical protein